MITAEPVRTEHVYPNLRDVAEEQTAPAERVRNLEALFLRMNERVAELERLKGKR